MRQAGVAKFFISKTVVNIHAHQLQNRRFGLGLNDIYFLCSCRANTYLSVVVTIIFTDFYTHTCLHTTILCSCFTTHSKKSKTMTGNTRFSYKACELAHIRLMNDTKFELTLRRRAGSTNYLHPNIRSAYRRGAIMQPLVAGKAR